MNEHTVAWVQLVFYGLLKPNNSVNRLKQTNDNLFILNFQNLAFILLKKLIPFEKWWIQVNDKHTGKLESNKYAA